MKIFKFDKVYSTNDIAFDLLKKGEKSCFAVIAESQINGRGSHGHTWISEIKGNMYLSFALDISNLDTRYLIFIPQCFALIFVKIMRDKIPLNVKWPNDIFYNKKKVGGVLLETKFQGTDLMYAVLGIGINISAAPEINLMDDANYEATSISIHDKGIDYDFVLKNLIRTHDIMLNLIKYKHVDQFIHNNWNKFDLFF